jgi:hypothetical protein
MVEGRRQSKLVAPFSATAHAHQTIAAYEKTQTARRVLLLKQNLIQQRS